MRAEPLFATLQLVQPAPPARAPSSKPRAREGGKGSAPSVPKAVGLVPRLQRAVASNGWDAARALAFYAWVLSVSACGAGAMALLFPLVELFDREQRRLFDRVACLWAFSAARPFFSVSFTGPGGGPPPAAPPGACIYVLNHQSWLDAFVVLRLRPGAKILARADVAFNLPLIGWAMRQLGFVSVAAGSIASYREGLERCRRYLRAGVPLVFFAEGRLSQDRRPLPFQRGAFLLAKEAGVPVVPVTIDGTGRLMPASSELTLRPEGSPGVRGERRSSPPRARR
eukprot:tig00000144_g9016.t1